MCAGLGLAFEDGTQEFGYGFFVMGARPSRPGLAKEPDQPLFEPLLSPMPNRGMRNTEPGGDRDVRLAIRRHHDNLDPPYQTVRR